MDIYGLTPLGKRAAQNVRSPDTPEWRIVHYLDKVGAKDKENIANYCGLSEREAAMAIRRLRGVVAKQTMG